MRNVLVIIILSFFNNTEAKYCETLKDKIK